MNRLVPEVPYGGNGGGNGRGPTIKLNPPPEFTGKDRSKLLDFLSQCKLHFLATPLSFATQVSRVVFAGSYLRGPAGTWFTHFTSLQIPPAWLNDWPLFQTELQLMFGEVDPIRRSEDAIKRLRMAEPSGRAVDYMIEFQVHEYRLRNYGYDDAALTRMFYDGLNNRLVHALGMLPEGRPTTLEALQQRVIQLDQNYWETRARLHETSRAVTTATVKDETRTRTRTESHPRSGAASAHCPAAAPARTRTSAPTTRTTTTTTTTRDLSKVLGPDSHLKAEEKEKRQKEGRCAYCGLKNHTLNDCPSLKDGRRRDTCTARATVTVVDESDAESEAHLEAEDSGNDPAAAE